MFFSNNNVNKEVDSLYPRDGQFPSKLSFADNLIVLIKRILPYSNFSSRPYSTVSAFSTLTFSYPASKFSKRNIIRASSYHPFQNVHRNPNPPLLPRLPHHHTPRYLPPQMQLSANQIPILPRNNNALHTPRKHLPSCNPHEKPETSYINLLKEKLKLQVRFLEQTIGFPDPAGEGWGKFWKRLGEEGRELFVKVWSLQGEVQWVGEEMAMRRGVW